MNHTAASRVWRSFRVKVMALPACKRSTFLAVKNFSGVSDI